MIFRRSPKVQASLLYGLGVHRQERIWPLTRYGITETKAPNSRRCA